MVLVPRVALLGGLLLTAPSMLPAQSVEDVLALQRAADRRGRAQLFELLDRIRVDVNFDDVSAKDLAGFLMTATGNVTNFAVWTKAEIEPITLRLKRAKLTTVMDIAQRFAKVRFVYTKGMVLIQHPDEVVEFTSLRRYDIRAATLVVPSFPGPELKLTAPGDDDSVDFEDDEEAPTTSGFTADKLVDLVRTQVLPESWDDANVSITEIRGVLWVRQTDRGHAVVEELLAALGAIPPPAWLLRQRLRAQAAVATSVRRRPDRPAR